MKNRLSRYGARPIRSDSLLPTPCSNTRSGGLPGDGRVGRRTRCTSDRGVLSAVISREDLYVMGKTLAHTGTGNWYEYSLLLQIRNGTYTAIAHARTQTAHHLIDDVCYLAAVWHD